MAQDRKHERGSALVYILIAIALLAALTVSFMEPSSQQTSSQNTFKSASVLQGQADTIRSAIQECILMYPQGDKCIKADAGDPTPGHCTTNAVTVAGALDMYPIDPDSTFYTNATPGRSGDNLVRNLRCPGHNGGENNDHDNHEKIFSGMGGKFMPPPPDLFGEWKYYNGLDGVFYWIETDKTDAYIKAALQKLEAKFSTCEADVIDAAATAKNLDDAGTVECTSGNLCFRVWMVIDTDDGSASSDDAETSIYPDETACNTP
jgi:type II secretory pathway pseudopilin PulG